MDAGAPQIEKRGRNLTPNSDSGFHNSARRPMQHKCVCTQRILPPGQSTTEREAVIRKPFQMRMGSGRRYATLQPANASLAFSRLANFLVAVPRRSVERSGKDCRRPKGPVTSNLLGHRKLFEIRFHPIFPGCSPLPAMISTSSTWRQNKGQNRLI